MDVTNFNIHSLDLTPAEKEVVRKLIRQGYTIKKLQDIPSIMRCPKCQQKTDNPFSLCWICKDAIEDAYDFP